MGSSEEDVMKMRLLIDGDGQGDDRRMVLLMKNLFKFCSNKESDEKAIETAYQRMLGQMSMIEYFMDKTRFTQDMNQNETDNYIQLETNIIEGIDEARHIIEQTKVELEQAKVIRRHKLEYDEIGKKIAEFSSREDSEARIREVEAERESLRTRERDIENKLARRRSQFSVIIKSIHELQELILNEDGVGYLSEDEEDSNTKDNDVILLENSQD